MHLGQPRPGFANRSKAGVESGWTWLPRLRTIRPGCWRCFQLVRSTRVRVVVLHRLVGCMTSQLSNWSPVTHIKRGFCSNVTVPRHTETHSADRCTHKWSINIRKVGVWHTAVAPPPSELLQSAASSVVSHRWQWWRRVRRPQRRCQWTATVEPASLQHVPVSK